MTTFHYLNAEDDMTEVVSVILALNRLIGSTSHIDGLESELIDEF